MQNSSFLINLSDFLLLVSHIDCLKRPLAVMLLLILTCTGTNDKISQCLDKHSENIRERKAGAY